MDKKIIKLEMANGIKNDKIKIQGNKFLRLRSEENKN